MKDYLSYRVEDFVTDESYLRYYYKEDGKDILFWTLWIQRHPEKLDVIISANNYIDALSIRLSEAEFQKEQQRFEHSLEQLSLDDEFLVPITEGVSHQNIVQHTGKKVRVWRIAAGFAAVAAGMFYMFVFHGKGWDIVSTASNKEVMIEKYVPKGERAKILLPDGSEVELNSDSRLTYPAVFTGASRDVKLSGEAFFRIKENARLPFHVNSGNLHITVLGTSFNVQSYPGQKLAKVAVVTGKIKVTKASGDTVLESSAPGLELHPSELVVFNTSSRLLEKKTYDVDEETGWRQGAVVFSDASFADIADRFDKIYNIRLINQSSKTEFSFNGAFSNTSPEEIIKSICLSKQLSYTINGNIITIH
ncbi:FecR family protein [Filimonas effusa]|uniref:FecR family protein n=1 Tax=Filimonas effusa TaxID=2508721 RepID=A0A4V1M9K0_9BACT|nr:FecR family protein [Filimonas effusa]RXK81418.1 FecR family protein [Filimonas effusa]